MGETWQKYGVTMPRIPRDTITCHRGAVRAKKTGAGAVRQDKSGDWWTVKRVGRNGRWEKKWCEYDGPLKDRKPGCGVM